MKTAMLMAAALAATVAATPALAQQPQTQRLRGTIERADGNMLFVKGRDGTPMTLKLNDNAVIVAALKASLADIKEGDYVGAGAVPQPDGSQKALEVHIFAESMRGTGDGHRGGWYGAPDGTMTNGEVGNVVKGVDGNVLVVKYKGGEKRIIVPPGIPIVRYEIGSKADIKAGADFSVQAATKQSDGTFSAARINIARPGAVMF